jgi:hypothetical protein
MYRTITYLGRDGDRLTVTRFVTLGTSLHNDSDVASLTVTGRRAEAPTLAAVLQRATTSLMIVGG